MFLILNFDKYLLSPFLVKENIKGNNYLLIFTSYKEAYGYTISHKIIKYSIVVCPPDWERSKNSVIYKISI